MIGLSLAWELAGQGRTVTVLDRQQTGREASWAGAGILPPGNLAGARHPFDRLRALSVLLWDEWSRELKAQTGIDNGYRRCGGLTVSLQDESCTPRRKEWVAEGVELEPLDGAGLRRYEPELSPEIEEGFRLPGLGQVRNPWHLQALAAACERSGVNILRNHPVQEIHQQEDRVTEVLTPEDRISGDRFCFTSGAWTANLLNSVGCRLPIVPVRGQIVLYHTERPLISHVIEVGKRYLVPRQDGRLLVGSTEEHAGFEKKTTQKGIAGLKQFAESLLPALKAATVEKSWAGLRPRSLSGAPFIGQVPGLENAFVAAGHFRAGLQTSPATAVVMRQLVCCQETDLDLTPFIPDVNNVESAW